MGIIGDVFGLNSIYERQVQNVDNNNFESWPESATHGYFAGGSSPLLSCTIDRLDFSNETASAPGNNLTQSRAGLAAVSNNSYGYFGGGDKSLPTPTKLSTIQRLDFSNETVVAPGTYQLTQARTELAAVSSSNYGYFGGGFTPPTVDCTIDRLDFSTETVSSPGNGLTQARRSLAAVSNSNYGYFGGGSPSPPSPPPISGLNTIDRLDFSTETLSSLGNDLPQAKYALAAVSNSNYGYFGDGQDTPTTWVCTIDRLDFSNETVLSPGNNLPQTRNGMGTVSSSSYGYFGGGIIVTAVPNVVVCTIDRLDFSTETASAPGNGITQERRFLAAVSGGQSQRPKGSRTYGYFVGGSSRSIIERLDFSSDTFSDPGNVLPENRRDFAATSNSSYGFFGGGDPFTSTIERFDFSNETATRLDKILSEARREFAATSSNSYGYFAGGQSPTGDVCTIDRLDFFSETIASPGNYQLLKDRNELAATSSSSYGYFVGSITPSDCTIDRLDFSNETVSRPDNNLPQNKYRTAEVSNNLYAYFGGGSGTTDSTILRLDFSNETTNNPGSVLDQARQRLAAVSSSSYGYFAGGNSPNSSAVVDSFDFSTEVAARAANDLPATRTRLNAVFN